jgi:hypothetical protein
VEDGKIDSAQGDCNLTIALATKSHSTVHQVLLDAKELLGIEAFDRVCKPVNDGVINSDIYIDR